jgi:hypothetical protein
MSVKFITAAEAAKRNDLSVRRIQQLCQDGKIPGAQAFGSAWMVPAVFKWAPQKPGPKAGKRNK